MTYHRPNCTKDDPLPPPVDVIGLSQAIMRTPDRWAMFASVREITAMAETLLAVWQVTLAAQTFEQALNAFDQAAPNTAHEPYRIARLNETRDQLGEALKQITDYQKQEN